MHVTFVTLGMEQLGVEYLSAYIKQYGHRTSLVHNPALFNDRFQLHSPWLASVFDQDEAIVERIIALKPGLLAFSSLTNTFGWCMEVAAKVKARIDVPVIVGGVHASAVPDFVMAYEQVDYVCQSEGEAALLALCNQLDAGETPANIPNLWTKHAGTIAAPPSVEKFIADLDSLPFPDKSLYAGVLPERYVYRIMTARGCPYRCTFCFNNFFANLPSQSTAKEYVRRRSVDNVLEELRWGKALTNFSVVEFHDDIFTMNKPWLSEFLPRFKKEIGVPFICETHAKFMDEEIAQMLKDAGCAGAKMGIQSMDSDHYKRRMLKRGETADEVKNALLACKKVGLQLDADHIFGLPGESKDALEYALNFYREYTPGRIACFFLTYFPGIEITETAHAAGELTDEQIENINRGNMLWYHQVQAMTPSGRETLAMDKAYMITFHFLPLVPKPLRRFVSPSFFRYVPAATFFARSAMATKMLVDWLFDGNFGAVLYLRLYLFYMFGKGRNINRGPIRHEPAPAVQG